MVELQGDLKRTKNGDALPGTLALEDRIAQMHSQANLLLYNATLLVTLRAELPDDLSDEGQEALALLLSGGGK